MGKGEEECAGRWNFKPTDPHLYQWPEKLPRLFVNVISNIGFVNSAGHDF